MVYMAVWVDDCLCVGHKEAIKEAIKDLQKHFVLKIEENVRDYLGCEIAFTKEKNRMWIGQPDLLKKLERNFGDIVKNVKIPQTPGTPHVTLQKPNEDSTLLSDEEQTMYRNGVGMLLYLVNTQDQILLML